MHETRRGEMAALGEVPYGTYYGGVDTTPLFVILAAAYAERTADMATIAAIWPALCAAMEWIARHGDADGDGLLDYAAGAASGSDQPGLERQCRLRQPSGRQPGGGPESR